MNTRKIAHAVAVVALVSAVAAGCSRSPAPRFYALTAVAVPAGAVPAAQGALGIGIRAVELPAALDRSNIATRTGANTFAFAEFERWSAPLAVNVAHVLAENLAIRLHSDHVVVYPWPPRVTVDREVIVEITRFDGSLGGRCTLDARWRVVSKAPTPPITGRSTLEEPAGGDYAALVAAESRLIDALSADLAAAIRQSVALTQPEK